MSEAKVQCPHVARQGLVRRRHISHFWDYGLVGAVLLASRFGAFCLGEGLLSACVAVRVCEGGNELLVREQPWEWGIPSQREGA